MMTRSAIETPESGMYVRIHHPDGYQLIRGCQFVSAYRAGFEDCIYARIYSNPFELGTIAWSKYDHGNQDARRSMRDDWSNNRNEEQTRHERPNHETQPR